jgi:hypothetical protein
MLGAADMMLKSSCYVPLVLRVLHPKLNRMATLSGSALFQS